ncbi:MAG: hypothetical protein M3464_22245 [Chloroflexota bacterium]|nr:hypothetical protein [Chloroflexota bacterium]
MKHSRAGLPSLLAALLLAGALFASGAPGLAQTGSPARPSHIHEGGCADLGAVIQPLTFLTVPSGAQSGSGAAVLAEAAFSTIPLTLDEMLAEDHSLKIHLSADQIEIYLACGDIGGALDADGALIVGLKEQDGSGYTGIAYLVPAGNGGTLISAMIAKVLPGGGIGDDAPADTTAADESGGADDAAGAEGDVNVVGVRLSEFAINMPSDLPAGPTQFNVTNVGNGPPHNFVIEGNGISERLDANLERQTSGQLTVDLTPGTYTIFCPVGEGGHRSQGMELTLTVS